MHSACSPLNILGQTKMTTVVQSWERALVMKAYLTKNISQNFEKKSQHFHEKKYKTRWQFLLVVVLRGLYVNALYLSSHCPFKPLSK